MDLGLSWIEWLWFPQGAHLILLTVVLFYASPGPSDSVPHLGLHGLSDSGPHSGIIGPWILYSTPRPHSYLVTKAPLGPHLDPVNLVLTWSSPGTANSGHHLGITWVW